MVKIAFLPEIWDPSQLEIWIHHPLRTRFFSELIYVHYSSLVQQWNEKDCQEIFSSIILKINFKWRLQCEFYIVLLNQLETCQWKCGATKFKITMETSNWLGLGNMEAKVHLDTSRFDGETGLTQVRTKWKERMWKKWL